MKPIHLKISGLNSFREEQEIDFTNLCETGVFGIFGPTGSGKSTVLDAITLALYGKVERAKGGISGIVNQNEEKAHVAFVFQVGGRYFSAERTYKKGSDGSIGQQGCRLIEYQPDGPQVIAEKKREMDEKIQHILGLTSEDFTRAVVLPQGKFQEFLTLQGSERRKMLQRIFNLEKYGEQLTQSVKKRLNETKIKEENIKSRQSELGDASPQVIEHLTASLVLEKNNLLALKRKALEFRKKEEEIKLVLQLEEELTHELALLKCLKDNEVEIKNKEERLTRAGKADSVKPFITFLKNEYNLKNISMEKADLLKEQVFVLNNAYQEAEKNLSKWQEKQNTQGADLKITLHRLEDAFIAEQRRDELQVKRQLLLDEYTALNKSYKDLRAEVEELEDKKRDLQNTKQEVNKEIQAREEILNQEEQIDQQKESLQSFQDIEKHLFEFTANIKTKEENYEDIQNKVQAHRNQLKEITQQLQNKEKEKNQLVKPAMGQGELNKYREAISSWEKEAFTLEHYQEMLMDARQLISENVEKQSLLGDKLQKQKELYILLSLEKDNAESLISSLEELIRDKETKSYGALLGSRLQRNLPCPVCGSLEHPHPAQLIDESEQELKTLGNKLLLEKENLKRIEERFKVVAQEVTALELNYENSLEEAHKIQEKLQQLQTAYDLNLKNLPSHWQQLLVSEIKLKLAVEMDKFKNEQIALESYTSRKEKLGQELDILLKQVNEAHVLLKQEEARAAAVEEDLADLRAKEKEIILEREKKLLAFRQSAGELGVKEILDRIAVLKQSKQDMERLRRLEKETAHQLEQCYEQLSQKNEQGAKLLQSLDSIKQDGQNCSNLILDFSSKIEGITGGRKPQEAKEYILQEIKVLGEELAKAVENMEQKRTAWEEKKSVLLATEQEIERISLRIYQGERELEKKLVELGFGSSKEAELSSLVPQQTEQLKKEIENYRNSILIKEKNIEALGKKLAGRSITKEKWLEFSEQKEVLERELEESMEKVHKLEDRLQKLRENYTRWQELEKERKQLAGKLDQLVILEKLFRGNTFVEYIAEEQLTNISLDASRRLGVLTHYRYALEIDSEGGFIIRDDANGGLRRSVATLSGGETFLTSLALALALSGQIQLKGKYPLQFFFLDEGFGTLDSFLLETVMNSLEKLHTEKMTIGIISHVPELRARISRSLIVEPAEKGGRGTKLRIETA